MAATFDQHRRASYDLPAGATDCHIHVFGPPGRYPLVPQRNYTPPPAPLETWRRHAGQVGLQRVVLTQPSVYGTDNSAMCDAIAALGVARARGVAAVPEADIPQRFDALHAAGIRGIRLFMNGADAASLDRHRASFERVHAALDGSGWHIELLTWAPVLAALHDTLAASSVPVVVDHIGRPQASEGLDSPDFQRLLDLAQRPGIWVKLSSPYRVSADRVAALPFFRAFLQRDTRRLLWGTDWPHPHFDHSAHRAITDEPTPGIYSQQDFGALLDVLPDAGADAALIEAVLVANPARLYGF